MKYFSKKLKNGLTAISVPMPSFESATVLVMVGAGSRYETRLNNGISHFLEHMAFKGTEKRPSAVGIASLIDAIGGEVNAFTSKEYTGYYIKSAAEHANLSADILSDMLQNSLLDSSETEKEKGVIIEEINLYEDNPARKLDDVFERLLYGDTPLGWDIAGEKDIIRKITREDFVEYMKSLYSAGNMCVVVAGGVEKEKAFDLVEKFFGKMSSFDTLSYKKVIAKQTKPQVFIKYKKTDQAHMGMGFRTVATDDKRKRLLNVLAAILGGGMSSRLWHEIREQRGLAYYVRAGTENYQDHGYLAASAGVDPKRIDEAVKVMVDEFSKFAKGKAEVTKEELTKAKEYLKGHLVLELEDSRSAAIFYTSQKTLEKEVKNPDEIMREIDKIKMDEIVEIAKEFFKPEGLNLAIIGDFKDPKHFEQMLKL